MSGGARLSMSTEDVSLRRYVIEKLGGGVSRDDIVLEVCRRAQLSWPEAEAFVAELAEDESPTIARRQLPVLGLLAAASVVTGLGVIIHFVASIALPVLALLGSRGAPSPEELTARLAVPVASLGAVSELAVGGAMVLGGMMGLHRALIHAMQR